MATIPRAQQLKEYITFQTKSGARNAVTNIAVSPTTYASCYARITELGGGIEETSHGGEAQRQGYEIWCRYDSGITGFMQILWGTRHFVITAPPQEVRDYNNRRWMVIQAEEVTES